MYENRDARAELLFYWYYGFLPLSLPSQKWLLKLPNLSENTIDTTEK